MPDLPSVAAKTLAWGIILIPLAGALLACCWPGRLKKHSFERVSVACSLAAFLSALSLYPLIFKQNVILQTGFGWLLSGLRLRVDTMGLFFALFTSLIWSLASLYNGSYLRSDRGYRRYAAIWLLALAANLGLVLAEDLFSFFIFFEVLSLSAYFLIIHNQNEAAWRAGNKYLALSIGGGLLLLWGIVLVYSHAASLQWTAVWQMQQISPLNWGLTLGLILAGLGVKAGVMPLHVWLPDAHPAAPTPASALLSGVMIKAGAYGMLRLAQGFIRVGSNSSWAVQGNQLGFYLLWLGLISMLLGVTLALLQSNAKRLLAFHSISQMGYIVLGIGMCLYWGSAEALLGSLYHVLNHALFKSALFLVAGVIYWQSGELNLKHLGGWAKSVPLLFSCALIASAGISGLPPFNGYISKTLLHAGLTGGTALHFPGEITLMNTLFILTSAGTLASFIKFISFIFILPPQEKQKSPPPTPWAMQAPIVILSALILLFGVFPHFWLKHLIVPALGLGKDFPLGEMHFWALSELSGAGITIFLGSLLFGLAFYTKFFYRHWAPWPAVDYVYCRLGRAGLGLMRQVGSISEGFRTANQRWAEEAKFSYQQGVEQYNQGMQNWQQRFQALGAGYQQGVEQYDQGMQNWQQRLQYLEEKWQQLSTRAADYQQQVEGELERELDLSILDETQHWWEEASKELGQEGRELRVRLSERISAWRQQAQNRLIKKGQNCQPLGLEEEVTPESAVRYTLQYYSRDLSLGLLLILLVLLLFLFPLLW